MKYFIFHILGLVDYWLIIQSNNKLDAIHIAEQLVGKVNRIDSNYAIGERLNFPGVLGKALHLADNAWRINDLR